jgi:hypothetical protein
VLPRQLRDLPPRLVASSPSDANSVSLAPLAQNRNSGLEDSIRRRAYEIYIERGRQDGHAEEHWLLAEVEILGITHARLVRGLATANSIEQDAKKRFSRSQTHGY